MKFSILHKLYAVLIVTTVVPLSVAVIGVMDTFERWSEADYRLELEERRNVFRALVEDRRSHLREALSRLAQRNDVIGALNSKDRNRLLTLAISATEQTHWKALYLVSADRDLHIDPIGMTQGPAEPQYNSYLTLALSHKRAYGLEYDPVRGVGIVASMPILDVGGRLIGAVTAFDPLGREWLDGMKAMMNYDFTLITTDRRVISSTWLPGGSIVPTLQETSERHAPARLVVADLVFFGLQEGLRGPADTVVAQILISSSSAGFQAVLEDFRFDLAAMGFGALCLALALGFLLSRAITSNLNREMRHRIEAEEASKKSHLSLKRQSDLIAFMQDIARFANEATSLEQGVEATVKRICDFTGYDLGHAYLAGEEDPSVQLSTGIWAAKTADRQRFAPFMERTEQGCLQSGEALFDMLLDSGKPVLIDDVSRSVEFARREVAVACGLRGGFCLAIMADDRVAGVLEFYSRQAGQPAQNFSDSLMEIGVQLGRVAERTWMSDRLRRSAGEAVAANQAKTTFLANMSHELRTPLNAIIGFSELIKAEIFGPVGATEYADYVSDIHDSGKHLLQIINDVLDMAKIESGQLEPSFRGIDMAHIAETCVSMSSVLADKGDVALTTNIPNDLPEVLADSRMMKQIILNLLSNGIKFTPAQGNVVLSIAADKAQGCVIEVRDDGIGMDPADLDIIMQPFGQVDTNLNRENEGTGLGLPLVKSMVELHDGSVEIDTQLGRGTAVIITLPPERLADNVRDLLNSSAANG